MLANRLSAPLTDPKAIDERLDQVGFLLDAPDTRDHLCDVLKATPDLERALSRISLGRGGPRDIAAIRDGLVQGTALRDSLVAEADAPTGLTEVRADLGTHEELIGLRGVFHDLSQAQAI